MNSISPDMHGSTLKLGVGGGAEDATTGKCQKLRLVSQGVDGRGGENGRTHDEGFAESILKFRARGYVFSTPGACVSKNAQGAGV